MTPQSSSSTGTCPYADCRAPVTIGKKFCKSCGRPIERPAEPVPSVPSSLGPEEQTAPSPEPAGAAQSLPADQQAEPHDAPGDPKSSDTSATGENATEAPAASPSVETKSPAGPSGHILREKQLQVAIPAGIILIIAGFGYWYMKPKTAPAVPLRSQEPVALPRSAPIPVTAPPAQVAVAETSNAPSTQRSQPDDSLRVERERLAAERARLEQVQQDARDQEQRRQQELTQRQQDAEAQQKALADLKAKQEEQQRQIDEERRKLAEDQAQRERDAQARRTAPIPQAVPTSQPAAAYRGPSSGDLVWEGIIKGTELITIDKGQASSGTVTGALPGVAVLLQPTDTKKVSIASTPSPSNQFNRLVFRVSGNGNTRVVLKWSLP
jgi:hypothetical protein